MSKTVIKVNQIDVVALSNDSTMVSAFGGGVDYIHFNNGDAITTAPIGTGADGIAIGEGADSNSGVNSIAIGTNADVNFWGGQIAIG